MVVTMPTRVRIYLLLIAHNEKVEVTHNIVQLHGFH